MASSLTDRTLALAGLVQAVQLVQHIARAGMTDVAALKASIDSVFRIDAASTQDVYGGAEGIRLGLKRVGELFASRNKDADAELVRYVINVLQLERSLAKSPKHLQKLREGIQNLSGKAEQYSATHSDVIAGLAQLYAETLSTLTPRIVVNGDQTHLANSDNVNKIRALLLAAIRSAVLWRQKGGTRLQLVFSRRRYLHTAQAILRHAG